MTCRSSSPARVLAAAVLVCSVALGALACVPELSRPFPRKTVYAVDVERPLLAANAPAAVAQAQAGEQSTTPPPAIEGVVRVTRVRTAPLFERKGLVYRTSEGTYETDFYRELYAPPGIVIHEALVEWLERANLASDILSGGEMEPADWLLDVRIEELYFDLRAAADPRARFSTVMTLRDAGAPAAEPALRRRYALDEPAESAEGAALIRALSRVLTQALERIEQDVRAYFERVEASR